VPLNSLIPAKNSLFFEIFSLLICVGNCAKSDCSAAVSCCKIGLGSPDISKFPVKFPVSREFARRQVRSTLRRQPSSQSRSRPQSCPRPSSQGRLPSIDLGTIERHPGPKNKVASRLPCGGQRSVYAVRRFPASCHSRKLLKVQRRHPRRWHSDRLDPSSTSLQRQSSVSGALLRARASGAAGTMW
jgi:hypothetical protein